MLAFISTQKIPISYCNNKLMNSNESLYFDEYISKCKEFESKYRKEEYITSYMTTYTYVCSTYYNNFFSITNDIFYRISTELRLLFIHVNYRFVVNYRFIVK